MEQLVRRLDFITAPYEQRQEFSDELEDNEERYEAMVTETDLLAAFRVFRKGVCRPDFPGAGSDQCYFALHILKELMKWTAKLKEMGTVASLDRIHDFSLDFLYDLIKQGPGTGHMELWVEMMREDDFAFKEYYFNLRGKKLKSYVRFLIREFRTRQTGDMDEFMDTVGTGMRYLISEDALSAVAFKEAQTEFIELYIYMELNFLTRSKVVQDIHHALSKQLRYKYGSDMFKDIKDPKTLMGYLKRFEEIICHTNLATAESKNVLEKIINIVSMLLEAVDSAYIFHKVHGEILDFVSNICEKKAGSPVHSIVEAVGDFYLHLRDKEGDPIIEGNSELFSVMTAKMIKFLNNAEDHTLFRVAFVEVAVDTVLVKSMSKTPEHQRLMLQLIKACLHIRQPNTADAAYHCIMRCEKMFQWKEHLDDAREIMDLVAGTRIYGPDQREKEEFAGLYNKFCDYFARGLKRDRVIPQLVDKIVEFCVKILNSQERLIFEAAKELADEIELNGKKNKEVIIRIFTDLLPYLSDDKFPWTGLGFNYGPRIVLELTHSAIKAVDSRVLTPEDYDVISHFLLTAMKGDFIDPESNELQSIPTNIFSTVCTDFLALLNDQEKLERCILLIRRIVQLMYHEYDEISSVACNQIQTIVFNGAKILAPFFGMILDVCINREKYDLLFAVTQIYPHNPRSLEPHLQTIIDLTDSPHRHTMLELFVDVAKRQPHLFSNKNISSLIEEMFKGDERMQGPYLGIIWALSKRLPKKCVPHMKTLMKGPISIENGGMSLISQILKNIVIAMEDEDLAEMVMAYFEKQLKGPEDEMITAFCLNEMRAIGGVYRPVLEKRKGVIKDLRNRSNVQTTKDQCTFILDVLEGRSLESLAGDIKDVKEDIEELDTRVTQTEVGLVLVKQDVGKQKQQLKVVTTVVKEQGEKIGQLKDTVDDTKVKVEELDSKTLSHAPFWSRDLAKLMNPEDILDWRLLSSRLGYSNDDIRGWAQMHDPCMAMLNEWYATRKTSEATLAVLTALQEMDRLDAAVIVENAMKMSETVIEDEDFDYPEPPEVFISYQWGIQNEVKLLKQHLEKAGFTCWMDIGQMGGGDKLFEKIDKGIRGAKIVICCVTEKYAKSPNCNREVNLSVSLSKPIIPLLMEKLNWPPLGSMGPIFSEYLFIRFYTRPGEGTGDQRYWSRPKFQELLMQLSYNNVQPDEQKVEKDYKDWWCPVVEKIKIEKKNVNSVTASSQQKQKEVESGTSSPDVFISYQWGKQSQVHILYKRLTEMGFTCWMDIHQMGGGDSLYDKIDKGVRGSKIVLSCVTNKYSLSANCRREVSLADALKKPIVPLLLEKMTWPPSGPMSMVFTQLLYINFAKDKSAQERWDGVKFEELLTKIDQYVPDIVLHKGADDMTTADTQDESSVKGENVSNQESPRKDDTPPSKPPQAINEEVKQRSSPPAEENKSFPHQRQQQTQLSPTQQYYNHTPEPYQQQQPQQYYQPTYFRTPPQAHHQPSTPRGEKKSKSCTIL